MNSGHPEMSLGAEDWKAYDVCRRHHELEPMINIIKARRVIERKGTVELTDEKYPIDRV